MEQKPCKVLDYYKTGLDKSESLHLGSKGRRRAGQIYWNYKKDDAAEEYSVDRPLAHETDVNNNHIDIENSEEVQHTVDDKLFEILREDRAQSEARIERQIAALKEDRVQSEARVTQQMTELATRLVKQSEDSEKRVNTAVESIKEDMTSLKSELKSEFKEVRDDVKASNRHTLSIMFATMAIVVAAIAAVVTIALQVLSIVKTMPPVQ